MRNTIYCIVFACFFFPVPGWAANPVGIAVDKQQETITLSVKSASPNKVFTLGNPDRLVIDVPALAGKPAVSLPGGYKGQLLKSVRYGIFDPKTSRFVFELQSPIQVVDITEKKNGLQVRIASENASIPTSKNKAAAKAEKPLKPLIVIDAGHGGQDPGTIAEDGTEEKDVVLGYAKAVRNALLKTGRYRVKLTREDDRFIILRSRVEIARRAKADLFVSLHADSAPADDARGLSVYTLSEKASDAEAEALAARENKADVLAGIDLSHERDEVANILISLAGRETQNRSATLADLLVVELDDRVTLLPNTHRFAGFAVLKAPDIPSVLIETGFLSHHSEVKLLKSSAHREKVAGGIASAIDRYFTQYAKPEQ